VGEFPQRASAGYLAPLILRFGEFELDDAQSELRRGGARVEIQPKPLELLLYLARHRERVVPKRELLEQVWPGVVVGEGALTTAVNTARAVLQDGGAEQRVIQTLPRRGYRFVAEVAAAPAAGLATSDGFIGREDALARLWAAFEQAHGVGDACDNCVNAANPRVTPDSATYLSANSWATLTGGQRDDDHDGYGNKCDAKFPGTTGAAVGTGDLAQFRASFNKARTGDNCGSVGTHPCAIFDLDEGAARRSEPPISRSSGSCSTRCRVRSARPAR
jgi:DNA-binding winged helix-turn-helix (wHTH) protein